MDWYYANAGQQVGPVSEAEFENLVNTGTIQPDTLVWREGLANWQPLASVRGSGAATAEQVAPPPEPAAAPAAGEVFCTECGRAFSFDNVIQYGNAWVCAGCKPRFLQRLREGVPLTGVMEYGGFWIRLGAKFIDGLILGVVVGIPIFIALFVVGMGTAMGGGGSQGPPPMFIAAQVLFQLVYWVAQVCYNGFFVGKFAATPGKMACGLKVVTPDGGPVSYGRAFGRAGAEVLNGFTCTIGYIIAAFDKEKRALHDHIANTRVVRK